ncbi:flippase [Candidatus Borrarchaeum sp.]|uniref:flippase n=1 Tax=Candidatus Borrarchaeum sp. TaxID=2846742 RepID=UPI00257E473A|nr:flippase [Candidatus Borrarchaeum sp.]
MDSKTQKSDRIVKHIFKGTASSQILQISTILINIIYSVILLRLLPPREVGLLELAGAPFGILFVSTNLGLDSSVIFFLSKSKKNTDSSTTKNTMISAFSLRFIIVTISALAILLFSESLAIFYGDPLIETLLRIKAIHFFIVSLEIIPCATFNAYHKYEYPVYISVSTLLLSLVIVPSLITLGFGVIGAAIGELIAGTILTIATLFVWRKFFPKDSSSSNFKGTSKKLLAYGLPLAVDNVFSSISTNSGKLILGSFGPPEWIAYYSVAYNIFQLPMRAAATARVALFPTMSELESEKEINYLAKTFRMIINYLAILIAFLVGSILILADPFIILLYTQRYSTAILLTQIMVIGNLFRFIGMPIETFLLAKGKPKIITIRSMITLGTTIFLEILLISTFGLIGASIAKVLSPLPAVIFLLLFLKSRTKQVSIDYRYLIKIYSIFTSSFLVSYLLTSSITYFGAFALFLFLFIFLSIILRGFTKQDLIMLAPVLDFFPYRLSLFMRKIGSRFYSILRDEK